MGLLNVVVVGCGGIGRRHLESLLKSQFAIQLYAVDPDSKALNDTRNNIQDAEKNVEFLNTLDDLPRDIELVVVATSSTPRLSIMEGLFAHSSVRYMILEKVLFCQEADYFKAESLIQNSRTQVWVNCPRRIMPAFENLKTQFVEPLVFEVSGTEWGLACNAIHFIDLVAYFAGSNSYVLDASELEQKVFSSKRPGFSEFYGSLYGTFDTGDQFVLTCHHGTRVFTETTINTPELTFSQTSESDIGCFANSDGTSTQKVVQIDYQSDLTHRVLEQLLSTGGCSLAAYGESMRLHLPMIHAFTELHSRVKGRIDGLLIT